MPLVAAGQTEGWKLHLQQTSGAFLRAAPSDSVVFAGTTAGQPINPANLSTHLFQGGTHLCATTHGRNTRRLTTTTVSIDGGGSTALPVSNANCPLLLSFFSLEEIQTTNARIWSFNGVADATPISGVNVYLAEGAVSTSWVLASGSANYLALADNTDPDVEANFWIAISTEGSGASGSTTGALKISLSYV